MLKSIFIQSFTRMLKTADKTITSLYHHLNVLDIEYRFTQNYELQSEIDYTLKLLNNWRLFHAVNDLRQQAWPNDTWRKKKAETEKNWRRKIEERFKRIVKSRLR